MLSVTDFLVARICLAANQLQVRLDSKPCEFIRNHSRERPIFFSRAILWISLWVTRSPDCNFWSWDGKILTNASGDYFFY